MYVNETGDPVGDSPVMTLLELEWMQTVTDEAGAPVYVYGGRAPLVRKSPESDWNINHRYEEALFKVQPYNVVFWKKDYFDPDCAEYVVLSRPPGRFYNAKQI